MDRINDHIIEQIIAFYLGEISDKDKKELEAWVNEFKQNEDDFKQILRKCQHLRLGLLEERAIVMKARIMEEWRKRERLKYRHRVLRLVSCVAILVLGIVMGCVYYESRNFESKKLEQEISLLNAKQGERVAVLQLASGEKWILKEQDERELEIGDGVVLKKDSIQGTRNFVNPEDTITENTYNTVMVPRGGEYNLTLADGTNVWLNSDSELKFPVRFHGNFREVYLKGEAFFEVKSNPEQPFVVRMGEADIRVLGTSFNVMNYEDENRVEVALQTGKVNFTVNKTKQVYSLSPGNVVRMDKKNLDVQLAEEDVSMISAWRTGYFYFENMPMEELVVKLERWYQVKFVFANDEVKRMRFSGAVRKYRELKYVLKIIEKTKDISFVDFGDRIKVYQK